MQSAVDSRLDEYRRAIDESVKPPPRLTVSQWADKYRQLSPEICAEPGRWKTDRAPYQRGIMDAFNDPLVEEIVAMTSSQVGKSEILNNVIGYYMHWDAAPILLVQPTFKLAEDYSKDRIATMIRDTRVLHDMMENVPRTGTSSNTILHKTFPGGHLSIAGANAPGNLCSRPKRVIVLDEVDRMPPTSEGDPILLAFKRANNFWNRKKAQFSTPTSHGASNIERAYNDSDQRKYFVPCPRCGCMQILLFDRLVWDKSAAGEHKPETTRYKCKECKKLVHQAERACMLASGKWIAAAKLQKTAGFWINELYSPWRKWSEVVEDFLKARHNQERLRVWTNTAKGETFRVRGDAPSWKRLYERRETYKAGDVQPGGVVLVAGVDVQKDRLELEVVAYGRGLESWSINYAVIRGDVAEAQTWVALAREIQKKYIIAGGGDREMPIKLVAIDSGAYSQRVYSFVRRYPRNRVIAIKGNDALQIPIDTPTKVDVRISGKRKARGLQVWRVGVSVLKSELYGFLRLDKPDQGQVMPGYCHFPEYGQDYFKQLTAEQLRKVVDARGYVKHVWELVNGRRNEALDCRNYARAAAALVGVDRFTEKDWTYHESNTLSGVVARVPIELQNFSLDKSPEMSDTKQNSAIPHRTIKSSKPVSAGSTGSKKRVIKRKSRSSCIW